jgi:hypothetical protein
MTQYYEDEKTGLKLKNTYTSRDFLDLGHNLSVPTAKQAILPVR